MEESFESLPFLDDAVFVCRRFAFGRAGPVFLFGSFSGTGVCLSAIVNAPHRLSLMVERRINAYLESRWVRSNVQHENCTILRAIHYINLPESFEQTLVN
jgi:hypothetical protein